MMVTPSGIAISFAGSADGRGDSRQVVARVYGFAQGNEDGDPIVREMVVPAGEAVHQDLPHGLYNVQLRLPSGRVLQRNVTVNQDSQETYRFFEDFAPGAGFSLQDAVGSSGEQLLAGALASSAMLGSDATTSIAPGTTSGSVEPAFPLTQTATLSIHIGDEPALEEPAEWTDPAVDSDELSANAALWCISYESEEPPVRCRRRWARITLPSGAVEIASLPLPWYCPRGRVYESAKVLVDPARTQGAATTVAVRDARLAGLLAYLDRGQASMAKPLLEQLEHDDVIKEAIDLKQGNALAACAAAYVGLAVYDPRENEVWDPWLANCMSWFPDIPDGAIVHARRLILRPTGREANADAAEALRKACRAGIPYFSAGVALLREMLLVLSTDFPDLTPLADRAGRLAGRVDPSQAFTVLRYPSSKWARP